MLKSEIIDIILQYAPVGLYHRYITDTYTAYNPDTYNLKKLSKKKLQKMAKAMIGGK